MILRSDKEQLIEITEEITELSLCLKEFSYISKDDKTTLRMIKQRY